ncbi:Glycerophosphoryl diester phosphodiesterase [Rubrivivax sp. A210]|uniref:esterase-like activity of phytase family protein n=1 Tax=Rubrivivax sp. A210 TaxID=2772301 RepID=UPI0019C4C39F|nr:esterase-like activity of phytase family protein [Rubrivivax sp. A210]CAD5371295.1 Glycerophosphoryl diester phosphodiesterase [Rubrivivax sp. A210]
MRAVPLKLHLIPTLAAALLMSDAATAQTLTGWARMPAASFADGPTSGQFAAPNPYGSNLPPYLNRQPVQGFSGVLPGPRKNVFRFLVDNGFGGQGNSADSVLRAYSVQVNWRGVRGGAGTVAPADWLSGGTRPAFDLHTRLQLNDARRQLTLPIQADHANYYNNPANPAVDPAIRAGRLLTGADFDVESLRQDRWGNYWFGDEFGPYLVKTNAQGTVLRSEIALPGVYAPQHKDVAAGRAAANLPGSGGFEGMAINKSGTRLYTLLERGVSGDPDKTLRIDEFDIASERYTGRRFFYPLEAAGTNIGDMVAVDDKRFVVLERNGGTATTPALAPFKKVYLIDLEDVAAGGVARKTELVDLMKLADPHDLNGDGSALFTLPYVTIENVLVLDPRTLLVVNDNNFPYGGGRALASDDTEFLRIRLPVSLVADGHDDDKDED